MDDYSTTTKSDDDGKVPTIMERIKKDKIRVFRTVNLYLSFLGLGMLTPLPGVTLLDLQRNVQATTTEMGYVLTLRFVGFCIGSLSSGWLSARIHRLTLYTTLIFITSVLNAAIPFVHDLYLLIVVFLVVSIAMGSVNTISNVLCLDIWMENPGPFFQALHFSYGLGAVLGPLIAEPFLSPEDDGPNNSTMVNSTEISTTLMPPVKDIGNVKASYCIVSAWLLLIVISSVISIIIDRTEIKSNTEKKRVTNQVPGNFLPRLLIGLGMVFLAGYLALENVFAQFLVTFVKTSALKLSKSTGSFMTSTFWGTYCFGRGLSVILSTKIKPLHLLIFDLTTVMCVAIIMSIFAESNATVMWGGSAILGFGCASIWPSSLSFMENYVGISTFVSGLFTVAGSLGGFLFSLMVTEFMDTLPSILLYNTCICSCICICALGGQLKIVSRIQGIRGKVSTSSSTDYLPHNIN